MIRPLRAIVLEARLDASPADVWHALTDGQALADWFPRKATAQRGVGGIVEIAWDDESAWPTTIDVWDPERHLRWADSLPPAPDGTPQPRLFIDWFISSQDGQTVLRLVHSGFGEGATWDDQIDGLAGGWKYFMWNLEQLLTYHRGRHRVMVWTRARVTATRQAFWDSLFESGMLSVGKPAAGDQTCTLTLGATRASGIVAMAEPAHRFSARFPDLANALLFVELEGAAQTGFHAGIWLSTYGVDPATVAPLQRALDETVADCVARSAEGSPAAAART